MGTIVFNTDSKSFSYEGFKPAEIGKAVQQLRAALSPERVPSVNSAGPDKNIRFAEKDSRIIVGCAGYASRNFSKEQLKEGYLKLLNGTFSLDRDGVAKKSASGVRFVEVISDKADGSSRLIGEAVLIKAHENALC
jgi:hypothetical protein